uniref:Olfactory receptor 30 n=1 Tax=Meteorus pulchricornis TaxID=51522 RepID=A0A1S5VFN1_9HYME|nr:olfactory receptor 30 [Meteorus pulchricornis]
MALTCWYHFISNFNRAQHTTIEEVQRAMSEKSDISNHFSLKTLRFFMQLMGMWPVGDSRERLISNLALFYTVAIVTMGVTAQAFDFYYSMGDLQTLSYNIPNTFTAGNELIKLLKFVVNRDEVMNFNAYTEKTFWKAKYDEKEYKILNECNRKSMEMVITHFFFAQSVVVLFVSVPIAETSGMNVTERMLPINLYFNFPYTESPYYEITFILEVKYIHEW